MDAGVAEDDEVFAYAEMTNGLERLEEAVETADEAELEIEGRVTMIGCCKLFGVARDLSIPFSLLSL